MVSGMLAVRSQWVGQLVWIYSNIKQFAEALETHTL